MNRRQSVLSVGIVAVSLLAAGCLALNRPVQPALLAEPVTPPAPIMATEGGAAAGLLPLAVPPFPTAEWSTDFARRTVDWEDIVSGGPPCRL